MTSFNNFYRMILTGSASTLTLVTAINAPGVAAQDTNEAQTDDEIIVTVERRSQSLQDLAGTAAVLQGEELKAQGLQNITDLNGRVPGLQIANNQGNIEIFIRGVGSTNNTELGDPAAATHLNGVYVPRPSGFGAAFFDIERVEVNIGPQGTLRGRNATAGSVNIIPWQPGLGVFNGSLEASYGNFGEYTVEGVVNVPVGDNIAIRAAGFIREHDSRLNNVTPCSAELGLSVPTCEAEGVGVAEAAQDIGLRGAILFKPTERLKLTFTGDYISQAGSGFTGVNFANPLANGIDPDSIERPRDVIGRAFTPQENTDHYGIKGQLDYDGDGWNVEYIGSYRDLVYDYEFVTPAAPFFEGVLDTLGPLDIDNFSRVRFITDSESITQELRIYSEDEERLQWAVGAFYFREAQRSFLGTTGDRNPFFSGVEFNQDTDTDSFSFYADGTYSLTDQFRLTGGIRYTNDTKERFGVNARYQFITGGAAFAPIGIGQGTEGFEFAGLDRTIFNPDFDNSGDLSDSEVLQFFFDGVAQFGARDGFDDIFGSLAITPGDAPPEGRAVCANFATSGPCPIDGVAPFFDEPPIQPASIDGLISFAVLGGNTIALQNGRLDNDFIDWRVRLEYDITEDNLVYALVSTGNRSGGFNDNVAGTEGLGLASPVASAPAAFDTDTAAPTFGPERATLFEIGTKNEFDIGEIGVKLNASAFYYDYSDQQLTTLTSTAQIIDFTGIEVPEDTISDLGLGGQVVSFTFNAADSEIYGAQFEGGLRLPGDLNVDATVLWLPEARVTNAELIPDSRFQADVNGGEVFLRDINGNRLIRTPEIQINSSISKAITTSYGQFDGIVSIGYRSSSNQTLFNGIDFESPDNPNQRLDDVTRGFVTIDVGVGFSYGSEGKYRIEGYASNLTNVQESQAIIITQFDNTRFFNTPRLYGVRVRTKF